MAKICVARAPDHPVTRLSFVVDDAPKRRCFWRVGESGDHEADYKAGARMGIEALAYICEADAPFLLAWIVHEMVKRGKFGGVETGFLNAVACAAMRGFNPDE